MTIQNPYIVGNPIEDSRMFFGRADDFAYLSTKMAGADQGGIFVLCGTRRSGKTSVLFQVLKGRLGDGFLPALVDMQANAAEGDAGFIRMMAEKIAAAASAGRDVDVPAFGSEAPDFQSLREAFIGFCRRVRAANGHRKLVLLFDEYELFEDAIGEGRLSAKILDLLGDLVRGDSGIFLVMAGSTKLEERDAGFWASCLSQSMHRRISFLSRKDAMLLIREPVAGLVTYEDRVPEKLLALGAGQPFYTQVLCQGLVDRLNETGQTTATTADVDQVVQEIVDNPLPHMIFTWGSLSDVEKVALAAMAGISEPDGDPVSAQDILQHLKDEKTGITLANDGLSEALERLFVEDLLSKDSTDDRYCFRMGLWHRWVGRMHSVWQVLEEIKTDGRKPDKGIINLARRRLMRTLLTLVFVAVALGLWFVNKSMEEPVIVMAPDPDSTLIRFSSEPVGARFFLDKVLLGESPRDSIKVPAGHFEYRWEKEGYHSLSDSVTLVDDGLVHDFTGMLPEMTGSIRVETTPAGAEIQIDGETWPKRSPATLSNLTAGSLHRLTVRLSGFVPATYSNRQVVVDSTVVVTHDFRRPRHPLTITTRPAGADLQLDGRSQGPSPLSLPSVVEGSHNLKIHLDGYYDMDKAFTVPSPGNRLEFVMEPLPPGLVEIVVQPYADIYLEGELVASATVIHKVVLPVGRYAFEFRHPSFGSFSQDVVVTTGDTTRVHHTFGGRQ